MKEKERALDSEKVIKIQEILKKGNNAEVKVKPDGSVGVFEVRKKEA